MASRDREMLEGAAELLAGLAERVLAFTAELDALGDERVYAGCGTSLDLPEAVLALTPERRGTAVSAGALMAEPDRLGREAVLVAVSRSGSTREVLAAAAAHAGPCAAVTCVPGSALASRAQVVLDLAPVIDPTTIAWMAAVATTVVVAVAEAPAPRRAELFDACVQACARPLPAPSDAASVAWLLPHALWPLGRELVRKTVESDHAAGYAADPLEFLHGEEIPYEREDALWVAADTPARMGAFRAMAGPRAERVLELAPAAPGDPASLLALQRTAYGVVLR